MVRGEAMKSRSQPASENAIKRELTAMKRKIREKARVTNIVSAAIRKHDNMKTRI